MRDLLSCFNYRRICRLHDVIFSTHARKVLVQYLITVTQCKGRQPGKRETESGPRVQKTSAGTGVAGVYVCLAHTTLVSAHIQGLFGKTYKPPELRVLTKYKLRGYLYCLLVVLVLGSALGVSSVWVRPPVLLGALVVCSSVGIWSSASGGSSTGGRSGGCTCSSWIILRGSPIWPGFWLAPDLHVTAS